MSTPSPCSARTRRRLPSWLGLSLRGLFIGLIFYFMFASLWRNWDQLQQHEFALNWQLIFWAYVALGASLFNRVTRKFECDLPFWRAIAAWFYSQLGKYLPGKVFLLAGRLHFYREGGRSALRVSMCFAVEGLAGLLAASFILASAPLFTPDLGGVAHYRTPALILVALLLVAIRPRHLELLVNPLLRVARRPPILLPLRYRDMLAIVALYALNWMVWGLGFYLLICAFYPLELRYLAYLAGSFALAACIGILALFAPAGIGVKEAVLVFALSPIMPQAIAIVVALAARVWRTVGELVAVGIVALALGRKRELAGRPVGKEGAGVGANQESRDVTARPSDSPTPAETRPRPGGEGSP